MNSPDSFIAALGNQGALPDFEFEGKTYKVSHPDQKSKARLELLIKKAEYKLLNDMKELMDDNEFSVAKSVLESKLQSGHYVAGSGSGYLEYMSGPKLPMGFKLYILSLLKEHQPEADLELIVRILSHKDKSEEMMFCVKEVTNFFFKEIKETMLELGGEEIWQKVEPLTCQARNQLEQMIK
jgi:hypothetical protein